MSIIQTGVHYGYYLKAKQDKEENLETCINTSFREHEVILREENEGSDLCKAKGD